MTNQRFASVWDAIADTPEQAANMRLRSDMALAITSYIESSGMTQAQAAKALAVTQPRVSDLMRGKIALFSLDALIHMLSAVGADVRVHIVIPEKAAA